MKKPFLLAFLLLGMSAFESISASQNNEATLSPAKFLSWVSKLKKQALKEGISKSTLDAAFKGVDRPLAKVLELDRNQAEFTLTFEKYIRRIFPRIKNGKRLMKTHKDLLTKIERKYGVPRSMIISLWGTESNFGKNQGKFPIIASLSTLAFEGRRKEFFTKELILALKILEEKHIKPGEMLGSWAGAMGHVQFMPSSFNTFAVDEDNDDKLNIWTSIPDALSSIGNYLSESGWRAGETWGVMVELPKGFNKSLTKDTIEKSIKAWKKLGVKIVSKKKKPTDDTMAGLVITEGEKKYAFLVFKNFRVILKWNRSTLFGLSVGILADEIEGNNEFSERFKN